MNEAKCPICCDKVLKLPSLAKHLKTKHSPVLSDSTADHTAEVPFFQPPDFDPNEVFVQKVQNRKFNLRGISFSNNLSLSEIKIYRFILRIKCSQNTIRQKNA